MSKKSIIIVLFDLPVTDKNQQTNYRKFRKHLRTSGYIQLQESVYVKLIHHAANMGKEIEELKTKAPQEGSIKLLPISLNNFKRLVNLCGPSFNMVAFSDDIVICS